jgi:hypothetical protein
MLRRLAILVLTAAVFFLGQEAKGEPLGVTENLRNERVQLPASVPDRNRLAVIAHGVLRDEGDVNVVVIYDDPQTGREIDYLEVYDEAGDLLMVMWFDRLGIFQVAVDRGLLSEDDPEVDGVLVLVTAGTAL